MRRLFLVIALLILFAATLHAQSAGTLELSGFFSNPGGGSSPNGTFFQAGYGVSANYFFADHWSGKLSVESERRGFLTSTTLDPTGTYFVPQYERLRVLPVDALVLYHFATDNRWKPYLGLGAEHQNYPRGLGSRTSPEVNGGLTFLITPHLGINADVKQSLDNNHFNDGPQRRVAFGIGWRF